MGGTSKKHAKGRLDKYYHMAKEQGYRARSAFKLIQLNKKFNFLEKSKVLIDLCAAPGGWLQVAAKYMPKPSVIIGVDLASIPAIPNVVTFVEDITTSKCRATLKKELATWKADVVLHDGAPNVGTNWIQDAFFQSELTLSALKLATEFLMPGGTFVSKVFRSKDYNKLMWVFNQLFGKVEATKPSSSRNVSAEIFVVCRDFLAPKKMDPRILDPAYVFKEVDDILPDTTDEKKLKERQGAIMNNIFHPEKRRRHRDGYSDGDYTLHSESPVSEFIKSISFLDILASSNSFGFTADEECVEIANNPLTTDEIKQCCSDLKVLGKKDFKDLIRWRDSIRIDLGYAKSRKELAKEKKDESAVVEEENEEITEENILEKMEQEALTVKMAAKKLKKKQRERKAKQLLKLRMGMDTPMDIGLEANAGNMSDQDFDFGTEWKPPKNDSSEDENSIESDGTESEYNSDSEQLKRQGSMEEQMERLFNNYLSRKTSKDAALVVKKQKEGAADFEEWYGVEYDKTRAATLEGNDGSDSSSSFSSDNDNEDNEEISQTHASKRKQSDQDNETVLSKKAKLFFDNPVFKGLEDTKKGLFDEEILEASDSSSSEDEIDVRKMRKLKKQRKEKDAEDKKDFEIMPLQKHDSEDDEGFAIETAQEYTLAQQLIRPSGKRDAVDSAYNRYAFNDPDLPSWFAADENKHNKPGLPITKEAVAILKQRALDMDARPIRKVAEAKYRKKVRATRQIEKMLKKAEAMNEDEDVSEKAKLTKISEMMKKAKSKGPAKEKPKLVIAKGFNKANKGRPNGVKGRYKMVDGRLKKDLQAQKRTSEKSKGKKKR